jgi:hypothetical protein
MGYWPNWMECQEDDDKLMPVTRDPSDFVVFVAGGHTKHSAILRGFASTRSVTRLFDGYRPQASRFSCYGLSSGTPRRCSLRSPARSMNFLRSVKRHSES